LEVNDVRAGGQMSFLSFSTGHADDREATTIHVCNCPSVAIGTIVQAAFSDLTLDGFSSF
jgi:hypothetical protein